MILEIPRENIDTILEKASELSSEKLQEKVLVAWEMQQKRFINDIISLNSSMNSSHIDKYIHMDNDAEVFFKNAVKSFGLS
jgi:predicted ATPase with chaperone activity